MAFLPLFACADPDQGPTELVVRDSAGVRIWEYEELPTSGYERWTTSAEPTLAIGEVSGDEPYLFARIRGALALPGGGIAVADGQSMEIRIFDATGMHVRTAGGPGSGPGEFTRLGRVFPYPGDSLAATNVMDRSISILGPEGDWGRTATFFSGPGSVSGGFVEGALGSGAYLVRAMQQFQTEAPEEGYLRAPSTYQIHSPEGDPGPVLGEFPDLEIEILTQDGRLMSFPLAMGRRAASVIVGDDVFVGVTDRLQLWRYGVDGTLKGVLRVGVPPVPMDDEIKERSVAHALAQEDDPEAARNIRQRYRNRIWPDSLPAFSDLRGDVEGNLWVRRFAPEYAEGPSEWWVFKEDGDLQALATLPEGLKVEAIGSDFVLGVAMDDLGVERVFRYRLEKE
jgi:hypothetical protein